MAACDRGQLGSIRSLGDCPEYFFSSRLTSRPTGYVAQTMFHFGGLATPVLLDSGATCSIIPEEVLCILLAYVLWSLKDGSLSEDDPRYPIVASERYTDPSKVTGVGGTPDNNMQVA